MARRQSDILTPGEQALMEILWRRGEATIAELTEALAGTKPVGYNSVQTMMGILERKGYATHRAAGRAFVYAPSVARDVAVRDAVSHVASRFFGGRRDLLALNLLADESLSDDQLAAIERVIAEAKKKA